MTVGFLTVFGMFGMLLAPVASTVQRWLPAATVLVGAGLVLLGAFMLAGREILVRTPKMRLGRPVTGARSMALYGISYAIASLGCTIGPFLVVTATTFRAGDISAGLLAYTAYAIGMGLVVGVLAVTAALTRQSTARFMHRAMPYITRLSGALLVLAVLAATTTLFARRRSRRPLTAEPSTTHATPNQPHTAPLEDHSSPHPAGPLDPVLAGYRVNAGRVRTSEVAAQAWVNQQNLQYYERRGLLTQPARSAAGYRA